MQLTLGQAAKQIGVSKPTLSKAIKSSKLSAIRNEDGSYSIDTSELFRYLDANKHRFHGNGQATGEALQLETEEATPETPTETAYDTRLRLLEERKARELAEARLADLKAMLDDLKNDRDQWRDQAQRLALPAPAPATQPQRGGFWGLFRKAG